MKFSLVFFLFLGLLSFAQEDNTKPTIDDEIVVVGESRLDTIQNHQYTKNPLRASLYSAIAPGLGQIYNERVWKAPVVWTLLAIGTGVVINYNNEYNSFREAFIAEINGETHEFSQLELSAERLADLQDDRRRIRDYAIAITALVYMLNIVDAAVDAHLFEFDKNPDLTWRPHVFTNSYNYQPYFGITINWKL